MLFAKANLLVVLAFAASVLAAPLSSSSALSVAPEPHASAPPNVLEKRAVPLTVQQERIQAVDTKLAKARVELQTAKLDQERLEIAGNKLNDPRQKMVNERQQTNAKKQVANAERKVQNLEKELANLKETEKSMQGPSVVKPKKFGRYG